MHADTINQEGKVYSDETDPDSLAVSSTICSPFLDPFFGVFCFRGALAFAF